MPWFMVDDDMTFHPKTLAAGNEAMGMWVRAGSWCQKQLNGGLVPPEMVAALGNEDLANRLVSAGLWTKSKAGFRFHQWSERQMSREEIENRRKAKIDAGRKGGVNSGASRRRSKNEAPASALASANAKQQLEQVLKQTGSPVPVPLTPSGLSGGEGHVSRRVSDDAAPPGNLDPNNPRCTTHAHIAADDRGPNCRACKAHREWLEGEPERRRSEIVELNRLAKTLERECPMCDGGWLLADDGTPVEPAVRCDHERRTA